MTRSTVNPLGRLLVVLALALAAMFGSVGVATAASAAPATHEVDKDAEKVAKEAAKDAKKAEKEAEKAAKKALKEADGDVRLLDGPGADGGGGPDAFLVTDNGRSAVFFCDPVKDQQRHNVCIPDPRAGGSRF